MTGNGIQSSSAFGGRGDILLAKPTEYDHYFRKAAILVYEHGAKGTNGVILNKPSAFPIGEMAPGMGAFASNALYMGGNDGGDTAIMIHGFEFGGVSKHIGNGIYLGGMKQARDAVEAFQAAPTDFRFVFNNVRWEPGVLEKEIEQGRWDVCRAPVDLIVHEEDLWSAAQPVLRGHADT